VSWFYRSLIRPVLFAQDSEKIHDRTLKALGCAARHRLLTGLTAALYAAPELPVEIFGLKFPNPVGLAAGLDKLAQAVPVWPALGFGFSELGAVTWHPQPGNPPPRLFRAIKDQALVNSMGFNNPGAQALAEALVQWKQAGLWPSHPVGVNLGKSKITPLAQAAQDYANSFRLLRPHADFFVVNVSSPNTPNLRQLQDKSALDEILAALQEIQRTPPSPGEASNPQSAIPNPQSPIPNPQSPIRNPQSAIRNPQLAAPTRPAKASGDGGSRGEGGFTPPILVKVAPDLSFSALDEILELAGPRQIAGIVATNTTLTRPETSDEKCKTAYAAPGGLSGRPLRARSTEIVRHLYRQTRGALPIIGVGGIFNAADAWEKITAGASLVQIYTGLIYEGPAITREIVRGLKSRMAGHAFTTWPQAVGSAARD
jgi:dihydroorotate dehydrogenase